MNRRRIVGLRKILAVHVFICYLIAMTRLRHQKIQDMNLSKRNLMKHQCMNPFHKSQTTIAIICNLIAMGVLRHLKNKNQSIANGVHGKPQDVIEVVEKDLEQKQDENLYMKEMEAIAMESIKNCSHVG